VTRPISPLMAAFRLIAFRDRRCNLTATEYDECFDSLTGLLEQTNDERFRIEPEEEEE